jgi:transcriptional regulator with XRE-family HTH domain
VSSVAERGAERTRAARLARYYRDEQHLTVRQIAGLLGRAPSTISAYLYDPHGIKAKHVKARYRGVCQECGASTWGPGPSAAASLCARCNGAASARWQHEQIEAALRAWREMFGRCASSTDLSITHARTAAARDGGVRLRRLQAGWSGGRWPAASVVQYHYGSVKRANRIAQSRAG